MPEFAISRHLLLQEGCAINIENKKDPMTVTYQIRAILGSGGVNWHDYA